MAGGATIGVDRVQGQYGSEVCHHMAVGAGLGIGLSQVGGRVKLNGVIDGASSGAVIMAIEVGRVAGGALATASNGRGNQGAVTCSVVAGGATTCAMGLTEADKRGSGGAMATDAIAGGGDGH